ncbi:hypothetical protein OAA91_01000 [Fibrobacterales bacterium]|nr:hypothetical protein [Fibrobacterales bacterium]
MKKKVFIGLGVLLLVLGLNWGYRIISSPDLLNEDTEEFSLDADLMEDIEPEVKDVGVAEPSEASKVEEVQTKDVVAEVKEGKGFVEGVTDWFSSQLSGDVPVEVESEKELGLTKSDLKGIKKNAAKALDKRDMEYTPKMNVNVGVQPSVKCEGSFELKNIKSSLGQLGGLGVIAHWQICTANSSGEVELKKNRASVTAVAMEVLIENFPKITAREKLEFTLWHKLNRVHPTALVSGVSLMSLELEPLK